MNSYFNSNHFINDENYSTNNDYLFPSKNHKPYQTVLKYLYLQLKYTHQGI